MNFTIILLALWSFTFTNNNPWILSNDKEDVKVYTRIKDGSSIKEFRAVTTFSCTKEELEKELKNLTAMSTWSDMVNQVQVLKQISQDEAIYKVSFDLPPIVKDRYTTMRATIKRTLNGHIEVQSFYYEFPHQKEPNKIFVKNIESKWLITGSDGNLQVQYEAYMDPGGSLPSWLINYSITDGPIKTLSSLRKKLQK
jgi:hypothetical protein